MSTLLWMVFTVSAKVGSPRFTTTALGMGLGCRGTATPSLGWAGAVGRFALDGFLTMSVHFSVSSLLMRSMILSSLAPWPASASCNFCSPTPPASRSSNRSSAVSSAAGFRLRASSASHLIISSWLSSLLLIACKAPRMATSGPEGGGRGVQPD